MGFEPTVLLRAHTLSRRASSTTPAPLRLDDSFGAKPEETSQGFEESFSCDGFFPGVKGLVMMEHVRQASLGRANLACIMSCQPCLNIRAVSVLERAVTETAKNIRVKHFPPKNVACQRVGFPLSLMIQGRGPHGLNHARENPRYSYEHTRSPYQGMGREGADRPVSLVSLKKNGSSGGLNSEA